MGKRTRRLRSISGVFRSVGRFPREHRIEVCCHDAAYSITEKASALLLGSMKLPFFNLPFDRKISFDDLGAFA